MQNAELTTGFRNVKTKQSESLIKSNILEVIKAIAYSYLISIGLLIISAFIFTYSKLPENFIKIVVNFISLVGSSSCGFILSKKVQKRGWLNGALGGISYMIILYLFRGIVTNNFSFNISCMFTFIFNILAGSIGGIFGVNNSDKIKKKNEFHEKA